MLHQIFEVIHIMILQRKLQILLSQNYREEVIFNDQKNSSKYEFIKLKYQEVINRFLNKNFK